MKRRIILAVSLLILAASFVIINDRNKEDIKDAPVTKRSGTAIILTGAAARIPQEAALLEELYNRGLLKNVVFISGVSSGALNAGALNAILSGKMTWDEYRKILFGIKNSDIFSPGFKKLPVNTEPERQLLTNIFEKKLVYYRMGDLPITTAISITELKELDLKKEVYRLCSRKINQESDTTLSVVDVLMASTAFPIAFPKIRIRNVSTIPDVEYLDGGVGDDHIPYHALFEFEKYRGEGVEKVYIISRKTDSIPAVSEELRMLGINDKKIFDKIGISIDNILKKGLIKRLKAYATEAPQLIPRTYVWIPSFQEDFLMFNFDKLQEQYKVTSKWAKANDPVPLGNFLLPYLLDKNADY